MKCEFTKDDNNTIWFMYAKDIYMRTNTRAIAEKEERMRLWQEQQLKALEKTKIKIQTSEKKATEKVSNLKLVMNNKFEKEKTRIGFYLPEDHTDEL